MPPLIIGNNGISFKTLLIVESPSKCKTIERLLGPGYSCVATCGHLRDLAIKADLSNVSDILSSGNPPPYTKSLKKMDYIRNIQTAISKCNGTIILATDADREGESIAWHVCQLFNLPVETTPRIVFNEITQPALVSALRNPRRVDMRLVNSQQARQVIDFVIGYGITPLLWTEEKQGTTPCKKSVHSAGRCQTPALRVIYDAHVKMKEAALNPIVEYRCTGYFGRHNIPFSLSNRIPSRDIASFLSFYKTGASQHAFNLERGGATYKPPPAVKTTALQQFGSSQLKLSPHETMEVAQRLYEMGHITYHRTESTRVSDEFRDAASQFVRANWDDAYSAPASKKNEEEEEEEDEEEESDATTATSVGYAHEAIRPVNIHTLSLTLADELGANEQRMYAFIWMRAMCSCMSNAVYEKLTASVTNASYTYTYNAYRPTFAGWRACVSKYGGKNRPTLFVQDSAAQDSAAQDSAAQDSAAQDERAHDFESPQFSSLHFDYLQSIVSGSSLPYNTIDCLPVTTNARSPYTYGGLIHQLEKMGIGRPSTFASIVHTLKTRDYITTTTTTTNTNTQTNTNINPNGNGSTATAYKIVNAGGTPVVTSGSSAAAAGTGTGTGTGNCIQITPHGEHTIGVLFPKCEPVLGYTYTREMEERLDEVANGAVEWGTVCQTCAECVAEIKKSTSTTATVALSSGILRHVTEHVSVRQGQYGAYIFYRTPAMKKPKFISLKDFPYSFMDCDACLVSDWVDKHI